MLDIGYLKIYLICQTLGWAHRTLSNLGIDPSLDPSIEDHDPWRWALSQAQANLRQLQLDSESNLPERSTSPDTEDILSQKSSHIQLDSTPSTPLSHESMSSKGPHSDDYEPTEPSIHPKVEDS